MKVIHDGRGFPIEHPYRWKDQLRRAHQEHPDRARRMMEAAEKGTITDDTNHPLPEWNQSRVRAILLSWTRDDPSRTPGLYFIRPDGEQARFLIPGLLRYGSHAQLGGNKNVGKTTMVADLAAALLVPGHRFLDHFPPVELTEEELNRGLWLINAETHPEDFEEELIRAGIDPEDQRITVEHLELTGGPRQFDLTDDDLYAQWVDILTDCDTCEDDFRGPFAVITDGVSAILDNDTSRYARWYARKRQLMHEIKTPNSLSTVHNTMNAPHPMGGVEAQTGPDSLLSYQSDNPDDPFSKRWFKASSRVGGISIPPHQVLREDGRLRLGGLRGQRSRRAESPPPSDSPPPGEDVTDLVLQYVRSANAHGHGPSAADVRRNVPADNRLVDDARRELVEQDRLDERDRAGRGGGNAYWVIDPPEPR